MPLRWAAYHILKKTAFILDIPAINDVDRRNVTAFGVATNPCTVTSSVIVATILGSILMGPLGPFDIVNCVCYLVAGTCVWFVSNYYILDKPDTCRVPV